MASAPKQNQPAIGLRELLKQAEAHYHRREWADSERLCRQLLSAYQGDPAPLTLLGAITAQTGRTQEASEFLAQVVAARPADPAAHNNYGNALRASGRPADALASFDKALKLNANHAVAHYNRGLALQDLKRPLEALESHERALRLVPNYVDAWFNRANALKQLGRPQEALESYDRALQLRPDRADIHHVRAALLYQENRFEDALQSLQQALALQRADAALLNSCGLTLHALHRFDEALDAYAEALRLDGTLPELLLNQGRTLYGLRRFDEALRSLDRAVSMRPDSAAIHNYRGLTLQCLGWYDEALESYGRALKVDPHLAEAYVNRGFLNYERMQIPEAKSDYDRAISLKPALARAYLNRAYASLMLGDFTSGWVDHEWRWRAAEELRSTPAIEQPLWLGEESLSGKTILLRAEQGFGDTIQFCRYVPLVAALGARVVLEAPPELARLLSGMPGVDNLISPGTPRPDFDCHCPLMSLPLAFRTSLNSIPASTPYLRADPSRVSDWNERLGTRAKLRVGLVWSGGFRPQRPDLWAVNQRRNLPLIKLAPLRHPQIEFYSLQKGQPAEQEWADLKVRGWQGPDLMDFTPDLSDFADTAALVENLDLVIAVDTSTAHLAGALGKPVWILSRFDSCWRWLLNRADSPWYPSARLYRQRAPGDWESVVEAVQSDLLALAG